MSGPASESGIDGVIHTEGMVFVPEGEFIMGSDWFDCESPVRNINIPDYWIDVHPVTHAEFYEYVIATGAPWVPDWPVDGPPPHLLASPVERVTWVEANSYAKWRGKRLPTEAEWEKASRGTDGRIWPWGNEFLETMANVWDSAKPLNRMTLPNGSTPGNLSPYGCVDMVGNVEEWVEDLSLPYPGSLASSASLGSDCRVLRGGSWFYTNELTRCSFRRGALPTFSGYGLAGGPGFRCAKS